MKNFQQIKEMLAEHVDEADLSSGIGYDPYRMHAQDDVGHDYFYLSKSDEFRRLNAYVAQMVGHPVLDPDDAFKNLTIRLNSIGIDVAPFSFKNEGQDIDTVELEAAQYPGYEEGEDGGVVPASASDKIPGGLYLCASWIIDNGMFVFTKVYFASGAELDAEEVEDEDDMVDDIYEGTIKINQKKFEENARKVYGKDIKIAIEKIADGSVFTISGKKHAMLAKDLEEIGGKKTDADDEKTIVKMPATKASDTFFLSEEMKKDGKYGYVAFYGEKRVEVYADTSFEAQKKVAVQLKIPEKKRYMIQVVLAQKDGKDVVHTAVD